MKILLKYFIIALILSLLFCASASAQQKTLKTPDDTYAQAQDEVKSEKKAEKGKRKRAHKMDKEAAQANTSPRHGWLFAKKRRKNAPKGESVK